MNVEVDVSEVVALAGVLAAAGPKVATLTSAALTDVASRTVAVAKSAAPVDTGALRDSISSSGAGTERNIGTSVRYARFVEYGTSKMGPRPFISPAANVAEQLLPAEIERAGADPF